MPCLAMLHDALPAADPALQLKHTCEACQVPCLLDATPEQLNLSPLFQLNPNTLKERCRVGSARGCNAVLKCTV